MINSLLTNLKYCGTLAFNRKSCKLSSRRKQNPREDWIVNVGAVEPLISLSLFEQAKEERVRRLRRYTPNELLDLLQQCNEAHGRVNAKIIASDPLMRYLVEMMAERGLPIAHTTILRWFNDMRSSSTSAGAVFRHRPAHPGKWTGPT